MKEFSRKNMRGETEAYSPTITPTPTIILQAPGHPPREGAVFREFWMLLRLPPCVSYVSGCCLGSRQMLGHVSGFWWGSHRTFFCLFLDVVEAPAICCWLFPFSTALLGAGWCWWVDAFSPMRWLMKEMDEIRFLRNTSLATVQRSPLCKGPYPPERKPTRRRLSPSRSCIRRNMYGCTDRLIDLQTKKRNRAEWACVLPKDDPA